MCLAHKGTVCFEGVHVHIVARFTVCNLGRSRENRAIVNLALTKKKTTILKLVKPFIKLGFFLMSYLMFKTIFVYVYLYYCCLCEYSILIDLSN